MTESRMPSAGGTPLSRLHRQTRFALPPWAITYRVRFVRPKSIWVMHASAQSRLVSVWSSFFGCPAGGIHEIRFAVDKPIWYIDTLTD